ncbi:MAG: ABC transporter permease, partial [Proteobacteria bacterium]|nr:ABC transporter permease [Pseudomonadota bacterium]
MIVLEPRPQPSRALALLSPVIAIGLTLLAGGILMALMGKPPLEALWIYFFQPFGELWMWITLPEGEREMWLYIPSEVIVKAIPLALIGAGLAVCFRANVWNIGAAGQYTMGAVIGGWFALSAPEGASGLLLAPYLIAGVLGGMAWAAIPALLRVRFNANEILVSLMLTYVAGYLLDWLVRGAFKDPLGFGFPQSEDFQDAFIMPVLVEGTRLHLGVVLAVIVAVALWVMMGRTMKGFEVRVIGAAPRAGAFAGFSRNRPIWFVMLRS